MISNKEDSPSLAYHLRTSTGTVDVALGFSVQLCIFCYYNLEMRAKADISFDGEEFEDR